MEWRPKTERVGGRKWFGFISHGVRLSDARRFSIVPQVTFSCDLHASFSILTKLVERTSANQHLDPIKRTMEEAQQLCAGSNSTVLSFVFLLTNYVRSMRGHSKQELGIALRHTFDSLFADLDEGDQATLKKLLDIKALLSEAKVEEKKDDIHRYPYPNNKIILIEYRLFSYLVSKDGLTMIEPP